MLAQQNKHKRDNRVVLDVKSHTYYVDKKNKFISVTTMIHKHFEQFDCDKVIQKMRKGKNWLSSKYVGMSDIEIKKQWNNTKHESLQKGLRLHENIEDYMNGDNVSDDSDEFKYFFVFSKKS